MTKFIGRVKEIQVMEGLKNSDKSEFLAVYGRRRVFDSPCI
jgi:AAA+ ATPase superfamily predicted ATPase